MSDNLPTIWSADPHTLAKHKILRAYWGAWVAILSRQGAKVNSARPLRYVDGFAGPGVYDKGEPGSPILALKVALSHEAIRLPVHFTFIEDRKDRFDNLKAELAKLQPEVSGSSNAMIEPVLHGKCADHLPKLLAAHEAKKSFGPALVFLDQFGYVHVPMTLIRSLMAHPMVEVFSYLAFRELGRFISDQTKWAGLDQAFGGPEWRAALTMAGAQREHFILKTYIDALRNQERGNAAFVWSFAMLDDDNRLLYWLVFSTNNIRGLEEMKKAMWIVDQTGACCFSDRDGLDQMALLTTFTQEWLAQELVRKLAGQTMSADKIKEWVLTETPCYLFKTALGKVITNGQARVVSPKDWKRGFDDAALQSIAVQFEMKPLF